MIGIKLLIYWILESWYGVQSPWDGPTLAGNGQYDRPSSRNALTFGQFGESRGRSRWLYLESIILKLRGCLCDFYKSCMFLRSIDIEAHRSLHRSVSLIGDVISDAYKRWCRRLTWRRSVIAVNEIERNWSLLNSRWQRR